MRELAAVRANNGFLEPIWRLMSKGSWKCPSCLLLKPDIAITCQA